MECEGRIWSEMEKTIKRTKKESIGKKRCKTFGFVTMEACSNFVELCNIVELIKNNDNINGIDYPITLWKIGLVVI